jgi:DNA repair exonuclease SbcCD ATPase subunit
MRRLQCLSAFYAPATSAAAKGFAQFWGCPPEEEQLLNMSSKAANSSKDPSGTATPLHTAPPPPPPPPCSPHPQQATQAKIDELDHILELKSHSEFSLRQQYDAAQAELTKKDQMVQDSERARRAAEAEVEALREQIVDAQTRREVDGDEVERLSQQLLNAQATHAQLREESGRASRRVELLVQEKAALQRELNGMQAAIKNAADAHRTEAMKAQHQVAVLKRLREQFETMTLREQCNRQEADDLAAARLTLLRAGSVTACCAFAFLCLHRTQEQERSASGVGCAVDRDCADGRLEETRRAIIELDDKLGAANSATAREAHRADGLQHRLALVRRTVARLMGELDPDCVSPAAHETCSPATTTTWAAKLRCWMLYVSTMALAFMMCTAFHHN